MRVLAIDQGTSATKALVIEDDGTVAATGGAAVAPRAGADGTVEQDPQELLDSILAAGREALAGAGGAVDAVALGNQGETVLRWDRHSGSARGPALVWQDRRATSVVERMGESAARLTEISGLPLDAYFAAPKMRWLAEQSPTADSAEVITTVDAWLTRQLTGAFVTDAATASRTMLLDLDSGEWSQEACARFEFEPDDLPEVVACDAVVGTTAAFGGELPLAGLIVDQQAALFAESCLAVGDAKCTYGTGAFLLANSGKAPHRSIHRLAASVAWRLGDEISYCLDGQVYAAGAAVGWLQRVGLIGSPEELDGLCAAAEREAQPTFVPALAGMGAPRWSADARGAWSGLSLATGRAELAAAVVAGIAAEVAWLTRTTADDLAAPLSVLRADGGLTRSRALMQTQADLAQVLVECYPHPDATALGVGALARLATGAATTPSDAVSPWSPSAVFEPSIGAEEAAERLEAFRRVADAQIQLAEEGR